VLYGLLSIFIAYLASQMGPLLTAALSILGILGGPLVAVFTLGIVFPFANQKGAISGALIGCTVGWIIFIGSKYYPATEFLTNRIPPEADFAACTGPAEQWTRDIKSFATGNKLINYMYV